MLITTRKQIEDLNHILKFTDDEIAALADTAAAINADENLRHYAELAYDKLYVQRLHNIWEGIPESVGGYANNLFWDIVYISGLPVAIEYYNAHDIPLDILSASVQDMPLWMRFYNRKNGVIGQEAAPWMWWSFGARLFRLGRLQFAPEAFESDVEVYKHNTTGAVVTVAMSGVEIRFDGRRNGYDTLYDHSAKRTTYYKGIDKLTAHVVNADATIQPKPTNFDLAEYTCVLRKGDPILAMHIPQGEPMNHADCQASFEQAKAFFPQKLGYEFKAYTCWSWLLDSSWTDLLEPKSNIRLFSERFTRVPIAGVQPNGAIKYFVFKDWGADLSQMQGETSLEKLILGKIAEGHGFREMSGFILND